MPSRKSVWPSNAQADRRKEVKPQLVFGDVFEDCPTTQVPETALAKSINGWPVGQAGWRPRNGTKLFGVQYPAIEDRTGYSAHKLGRYLISESGAIFGIADVSNIWVWDNGLTDEMCGFVNAYTMVCRDDDPNMGTNCHVQGKLNLNQFHTRQEVWIVQLGQDFWIADRYKRDYTKVHVYGADLPANAISEMVEDGDDAWVQNPRYLYRIQLTKNPVAAYPMNTPVPGQCIQSNEDNGERRHQYRYLYSCGVLDGDGNFIHRETPTKILTETGTNAIDENRRDWATINTDDPIGPRADTYGVLIGGVLVAPYNVPAEWSRIADMTFRININGLGVQEIVVDGSLVSTMEELAERLETGLKLYFPSATVRYVTTAAVGPHLEITSGYIKGGSVGLALPGLTGTDSAANLGLTVGAGAVVQTPYVGVPRIIRGLYLPLREHAFTNLPQWHHNFYHIYRTPDIGPAGVWDSEKKTSVFYSHLNEAGKRVVNSPDEFVWNKDLRVAAAFIARRHNGYIELRADEMGGEFELADEGSVVEFEDGSRVECAYNGYVNPKLMGYHLGGYYSDNTPWMAACIGDGHAVRITKAGDVITRVPGSGTASYTAYTAADERKPIWFPNGTRDFIREVINGNQIRVYQDYDMDETAMTYDPTHRNYCDAVYDEQLLQRESGWLCKNRFMRSVLHSNQITKQPGYVLMAPRAGKDLRYCPLEPSYKAFVGYHVREYQTFELDDVIERLVGFTNRYAVLCKGTIFAGVTNSAAEYTLPETFQKIWILASPDKMASIGLISYGSLDWIDDDWVRFITNTGEMRDFNGLQFREDEYGPVDYSEDRATGLGRFKLALKRAYRDFNAKYSRGVGFVLWWRKSGS
jgi:hypothetical protein